MCGLLGRNGAGKTTVMQILTGQNWQTSGDVAIFGRPPFEKEAVLRDVCFVKESQRYPDVSVRVVLRAAARLYPQWDQALADELLAEFALPLRRNVKKLSRGMLSAVGIIVGLASRARLTLFDEPYLGLGVTRKRFFGVPFLTVGNPLLQTLVDAGPFLLMASAGALIGVTYTRWGPRGLYVLTLGAVLVVGAAVFLLTWRPETSLTPLGP